MSAVEIWKEKLAHLQRDLAITSGAAQKFEIEKQIEEVQAKIKELSADNYLEPAANSIVPKDSVFIVPFLSLKENFLGRENFIEQLHKQLQAEEASATAVVGKVVHGLGGVGKTRLAAEYAFRYRQQYSSVIMVVADSPTNLNSNLAALTSANHLNLPQQFAEAEADRVAAVIQWLQLRNDWLLILDNVDDDEAIAAVQEKIPQLSNGYVLITGRRNNFNQAIAPLTLDKLSPVDSRDFLLQRTRRQTLDDAGELQALDELVEHLDGLALALEQAASFMHKKRRTFSDYLERWKQQDKDVMSWFDPNQMETDKAVAFTWKSTMDELPELEQAILNLLAWFAPEEVPGFVWETDECPDIVATAVVLLASDDENDTPSLGKDDVRDAIVDLSDFSMLNLSSSGIDLTVHRVVQEIVRGAQADQKSKWLQQSLNLVNHATPTDCYDVRTWPELVPLRPHLDVFCDSAVEFNLNNPTTRLMAILGGYYEMRANYKLAEPLTRLSLSIVEESFGENHPNVAGCLNNLALLLQATNRLGEAEPLMRRALSIVEESFGEIHPNVAINLNNIASLLQATNRIGEAEPLMRRALSIDEESFGENHPNVARDLNNLASLLQATNRLGEAEPLMRRALSIDEESLGENHPNVARDLNNLAVLLQDTNRIGEAEPLMRRALSIVEESFGEIHPNVAINLNNIASLLQATNRIGEAEPLMRRALSIDEESLGENHPNVARVLNNLAQLLRATNRLGEAEPLMRRALAIDEESFGENHPNVGLRTYNLAVASFELGKHEEAKELIRRAVEVFHEFNIANPTEYQYWENALSWFRHIHKQLGYSEEQIEAELRKLTPSS